MEAGAIAAELALTRLNERRLGRLAVPLREGRAGRLVTAGKLAAGAGLALRLAGRRRRSPADHVASALFLGAGLALRYGWVAAGRASATDHVAVAEAARSRA